jgi:hypothetical protein
LSEVRKAGISAFAVRMAEEDKKRISSKGWAAMIRSVGLLRSRLLVLGIRPGL